MPGTKLPFLRYMLIDQMLRSTIKPYPSKDELLEACKEKFGVVSASTIEKDLSALRLEFDAPIAYNRRHNGYEYTDKKFKFLSVNLSESNLQALSFAETILEEFRELPIFAEFSDAVDKVLDGLQMTRNVGKNHRTFGKAVQIDKTPYSKGSELLGRLLEMITEQKAGIMSYKKFNSESSKDYTFHPYLLKEYLSLWYVIGFVSEYGQIRTFALDRVVDIAPAGLDYVTPDIPGFDADEFYRHCIGVSVLNEKPEKILILFTPAQANYLKVRPVHPTQKILSEDADGCLIELELIVNYELKMLIMSFGANARLLAPRKLAEEVAADLEKTLIAYRNDLPSDK